MFKKILPQSISLRDIFLGHPVYGIIAQWHYLSISHRYETLDIDSLDEIFYDYVYIPKIDRGNLVSNNLSSYW